VQFIDIINSGVASIAIRSLAHAGEVLTDRRQQEEVFQIFEKINKETGWRIGFVYKELKEKWGWAEEPSPEQMAQTHAAAQQARERQEQEQQQQQQQLQQAQMAQHQQHQQQNMCNRHLLNAKPNKSHPKARENRTRSRLRAF
jgi:hypothetical protein